MLMRLDHLFAPRQRKRVASDTSHTPVRTKTLTATTTICPSLPAQLDGTAADTRPRRVARPYPAEWRMWDGVRYVGSAGTSRKWFRRWLSCILVLAAASSLPAAGRESSHAIGRHSALLQPPATRGPQFAGPPGQSPAYQETRSDDPNLPEGVLYTNSHALLIGVNEAPGFQRLQYCDRDVQELAAALTDHYGFPRQNVITLTTKPETTLAAIQDKIDQLVARLTATGYGASVSGDRVLVFFAGHGYTTRLGNEIAGYLVTSDADVTKPVNKSMLSMRALEDDLRQVRTKHVLLLADACYSGLLADGPDRHEAPDVPLAKRPKGLGFQAISAGGKDEEVEEREADKHGVFTQALLDELENKRTMGAIFGSSDLYRAIKPVVEGRTASTTHQHPLFAIGANPGEFLFVPAVQRAVVRGSGHAKLHVETTPDRAEVVTSAEGVASERSSCDLPIPAGAEGRAVEVSVYRDGFLPLYPIFTLHADEQLPFQVHLTRDPQECTLTVDPRGRGAGRPPADTDSLKTAVQRLPVHGAACIRGDARGEPYHEQIVITRDLVLRGRPGPRSQRPVLKFSDGACIVVEGRANVLLQGLTIVRGAGSAVVPPRAPGEGAAVDVRDGKVTLEDCVLHSDLGAALVVEGKEAEAVARRCQFTEPLAGPGTWVLGGGHATLEDCRIQGARAAGVLCQGQGSRGDVLYCEITGGTHDGIMLLEQGEASVKHSRISAQAEAGIEVEGGGQLTASDCQLERNSGSGISIQGDGSDGTIERCSVIRNGRLGISLVKGSHAKVVNSILSWNTGAGIAAEPPASGVVERCDLRDNGPSAPRSTMTLTRISVLEGERPPGVRWPPWEDDR